MKKRCAFGFDGDMIQTVLYLVLFPVGLSNELPAVAFKVRFSIVAKPSNVILAMQSHAYSECSMLCTAKLAD